MGVTRSFWSNIDTSTPVVVMYRGEKGALAVARTLGRLGVRTYLFTPRGASATQRARYSVVERSKFWNKLYFYDHQDTPEAWVASLLDVAADLHCKPILLTLSDWAAVFIERYADALEERYVFPRGRSGIVEKLADKWGMFELAVEHGVPTPQTAFPKTVEELRAFLRISSLPVVMKPADAFLSYIPKKAILRTEEEAISKWERDAAQGPPNQIVQEYIPGDATSVTMCNAYFTKQSECLAVFTGKKLRQVNDTGVASLAVCERNDWVAETTQRFIQLVGYAGPLGIGYRYDPRDGKYKLLDVNARVSGVFRLFASPNGADVVRIAYLDLTGQSVPDYSQVNGRKWLLEDDIISAYDAVKARKLTIAQWLRSMLGVNELHWFAADDLAPGFAWCRQNLLAPLKLNLKRLLRGVLRGSMRRAEDAVT